MSKKKKQFDCDCGCELCHDEDVLTFGKISETELYIKGKEEYIENILNIISSVEFF